MKNKTKQIKKQLKEIKWSEYKSLPLLLIFVALWAICAKFLAFNKGLWPVVFIFISFFILFGLGWWALQFKFVSNTFIPLGLTIVTGIIVLLVFPNISGTRLHFWLNQDQYNQFASDIVEGKYEDEIFYNIISGVPDYNIARLHTSIPYLAFPQISIHRKGFAGEVTSIEFNGAEAYFAKREHSIFYVKDPNALKYLRCGDFYIPLRIEKLTDNWYLCEASDKY